MRKEHACRSAEGSGNSAAHDPIGLIFRYSGVNSSLGKSTEMALYGRPSSSSSHTMRLLRVGAAW